MVQQQQSISLSSATPSERVSRHASTLTATSSSTIPSKRLSTSRQSLHRPSPTSVAATIAVQAATAASMTTVTTTTAPQETFRRRPSLPNQPCLEEGEVMPVYKSSQRVPQNHYPSPENNQDEEMALATSSSSSNSNSSSSSSSSYSPPESYQHVSKARLTRVNSSIAYGRHQSMPPPTSQGHNAHYLMHHHHQQQHHLHPMSTTKTHQLQHLPAVSSASARNGWTESGRAMC